MPSPPIPAPSAAPRLVIVLFSDIVAPRLSAAILRTSAENAALAAPESPPNAMSAARLTGSAESRRIGPPTTAASTPAVLSRR